MNEKEDMLARIDNLRAAVENGEVLCIALIVTTSRFQGGWEHSAFPNPVAANGLIAGLEGCKLDLIRHTMSCSCEKPTSAVTVGGIGVGAGSQ